MGGKVIPKDSLGEFVSELSERYRLFGPRRKGTEWAFDEIGSAEEMDLRYSTTILPPRKFFIPTSERILSFRMDGGVEEPEDRDGPSLIFGIHSCDLSALLLLDMVFLEGDFPSPSYARRRERTALVALTCSEPSENCFCESMGTGPSPAGGYDVLLTDLGKEYLAESGSRRGEEILALAKGRAATKGDLDEKAKAIERAKSKFKKKVDLEGIDELFLRNLDNPIWGRLGDKDLACGLCVNSCPTCFCFDVRDQLNFPMESGVRYKEWDACMLLEFSQVALGGNFRRDRAARIRQFIGHNLGWGGASQFKEFKGKAKCVGCGRCIRYCPAGIDLTEVAKELRGL
ncbi:MAG: 4Fe-4S dicluster domain-containing protein [Candidatus Bathyarchaeia archaeon]